MNTKKFIVRLLYISIALTGLITAGLIMFAPGGDVVEKGIATAFLILLTDGFILAGLMARHEWLKVSTWIASVYALTVAVILTWIPSRWDYSDSSYGGASAIDKYAEFRGIMENLTAGAYIILVALALACFFSQFHNNVRRDETITYYGYWSTIFAGLASGALLGFSASWDAVELMTRGGFAMMFLALTAFVIMGVSMIVANAKRQREELAARGGYPPFPYQGQGAPYGPVPGAPVNSPHPYPYGTHPGHQQPHPGYGPRPVPAPGHHAPSQCRPNAPQGAPVSPQQAPAQRASNAANAPVSPPYPSAAPAGIQGDPEASQHGYADTSRFPVASEQTVDAQRSTVNAEDKMVANGSAAEETTAPAVNDHDVDNNQDQESTFREGDAR
jgi:hypothetical protein